MVASMFMSRYPSLLLVLLLALLPATAFTTEAPQDARAARIRVVGDNNYPPYLFLDADGKPQGYEADMWRLFEKYSGIRVELVPMDWVASQQAVQSGRADVIDMLFRTPERDPLYDFSPAFATVPVAIYASNRIPGVKDIASMKGLPVGVERGDACAEYLRSKGVTAIQQYPSYVALIDAAARGELHLFCSEENPANYFLYRAKSLDKFSRAFVLYEGQFHRATRKGNIALLQAVERGMAAIPPSERDALKEKWLTQPHVLPPWVQMTGIALGIVLGALVLMTLWVWILGRSVQARTCEIAASENKLRALFDASPDAMWVKDLSGIYRECNDRTLDILGIERKQLIGQSDQALFPPEELPEVLGTDKQAIETGETRIIYMDNTVADGSQKHLEVIKVPLKGADGAIIGILGVARDITERQQAQAQLRLWAQAFQHAAFGMVIFDARTHTIIMANPTFARERGYAPEELVGQPADVLYPPDLAAERTRARIANDHLEHYLVETEQVTRDGRRFPVLLDCSISHTDDGSPQYVVAYAQNIGERKQAEAELRLAAVAFQTQEAMMVLDAEGVIQRVNAAFTALTGYEAGEVVGADPSLLESQNPERSFYQRMWAQLRTEGLWLGEAWISTKENQLRVVRVEVSSVADSDGAIRHYVCAMSDLTSEHEANARAEHMALFDPLTDLPNRNFLNERLQHLLDAGGAATGALLLLDLDHFKRINDLRSHATGDRLLAFIAQRLRPLLDEGDVLSRLSGGTFALLLPCTPPHQERREERATRFGDRIRQALHEPFWLDHVAPISVTVSIGWTGLRPGQSAAESVLKEAELAMYAAKSAGRDRVCMFAPAMLDALERQEALASDLLNAITEDASGLDLHLQLQTDRQGRAVGAEALLRWTRPNGEEVPPDVFIHLAEESGLILPLGDWVLQRACDRLAAWAASPLTRDLSLAVNVSAKQFAQPGLVDDVSRALARSGANPARLKLEITESAILGNLDEIAGKLASLRALGIRISLDDFGTGYSSLSYLSRLPLDQLKIDRSFINRLPEDDNDATVSQTIIGMGRGLGLEVIAEGVETQPQWDFLSSHGCDAFQGFLFARPLPLADFEALLQARSSGS